MRMKRIIALLLSVIALFSLAACGKIAIQEEKPKIERMRRICNLAVMDCYYHNVAKYKEESKKFLGIGGKDTVFWIEYSGIVRLGIDASLVSIEINDKQVNITMPEAKVLSCKVDSSSITEDSYYYDGKTGKASAGNEAFSRAQENMKESAQNDKTLLDSAQQKAMGLLEEYIQNIARLSGKEYTINWIYVDSNGRPISSPGESLSVETPEETPAA